MRKGRSCQDCLTGKHIFIEKHPFTEGIATMGVLASVFSGCMPSFFSKLEKLTWPLGYLLQRGSCGCWQGDLVIILACWFKTTTSTYRGLVTEVVAHLTSSRSAGNRCATTSVIELRLRDDRFLPM